MARHWTKEQRARMSVAQKARWERHRQKKHKAQESERKLGKAQAQAMFNLHDETNNPVVQNQLIKLFAETIRMLPDDKLINLVTNNYKREITMEVTKYLIPAATKSNR
jgi:hypothetical protein